jgi:hypothetical protein
MDKWTRVRSKPSVGADLPALAERGAERAAVERRVREVLQHSRRLVADCLGLLGRLEPHVRPASGEPGTVKPRTRGAHITRLSAEDVHDRLSEFERAHLATTGEQLSSAEFYVRFTAGEFDDRFGMRWATFYEAAEIHDDHAAARRQP